MKSLNADLSDRFIAFNSCTFHSEKFIAIRNVADGDDSAQLLVVNPIEKRTVLCQQTFAESIIMHPHQCIAALRSKFVLLW